MDRINRVLVTDKKDASSVRLGKEAQTIIDTWFKTPHPQFGGKSPEECLDVGFEELMEYVNFLNNQFMHSEMERANNYN